MTFLADPLTVRLIAILCAFGALLWMWFEWRRKIQHHRLPRLLAAFFACAALAGLGLRPASESEANALPPAPEDAALWTPASFPSTNSGRPRGVSADRCFALPGATDAPPNSVVIPDIGFLVREYPNVRQLHVFGDGVNSFEAENLRDIRVIYHPPTADLMASIAPTPAVTFARLPVQAVLGSPIQIQGRVDGVAEGTAPMISVIGPDGTRRTARLSPAENGVATFSINAPPAVATGRYVWTLELRAKEDGDVLASENVGVTIVKPPLPRVLVLEASPRVDTGRLQRWLGEQGARLTVRTQLGRDRFRITSTPSARSEVDAIDPGALADFDVVMADASVIRQLKESEREVLRAAIRDEGLGLLIVADESTLTANAPAGDVPPNDFFFPWNPLRDEAANGEERVSRLQWSGSDSVNVEPLSVPAMQFSRAAEQRPLVRDSQDRTVVAAASRGRGKIAFSLVRQTWPWAQLNDPAPFAAYWSFLFSELSRPDNASAGRWSIANNNGGPSFVNEPVLLRWIGPPESAPRPAEVLAEGATAAERLPLAQSATSSHMWESTYWAHEPGWHRVRAPGGTELDFFVSPSDAWIALQAERRRAATTYLALNSPSAELPPIWPVPTPAEWSRWLFFAVLFGSLVYLWTESRTARLQSSQ